MSDAKKIGTRIRELRKQKGFNSAEELAEKASIPTSTLYRIENGDKAATALELTSLAQALNVDIAELFVDPTATTSPTEDIRIPVSEVFGNSKETTPLDAINAVLRKATVEDPALSDLYRHLKRIAHGYPVDIKIGRGNMHFRLLLTGDDAETALQFITLMTNEDSKRYRMKDAIEDDDLI